MCGSIAPQGSRPTDFPRQWVSGTAPTDRGTAWLFYPGEPEQRLLPQNLTDFWTTSLCTAGVCVPSDDTIRVVSSPDLGSFTITCIQPGPFRRCTSSPVGSLHSFGSVHSSWPSSHQTLCWCTGHPDPAERVAQRLRHAGLDLEGRDAAAGRRCASLRRYIQVTI